VETGKTAVATPSMLVLVRAKRELLSEPSVEAETQVGLPPPTLSSDLAFKRRTGESEVEGRATQSMMLVMKVDMDRIGALGVDEDTAGVGGADMLLWLLELGVGGRWQCVLSSSLFVNNSSCIVQTSYHEFNKAAAGIKEWTCFYEQDRTNRAEVAKNGDTTFMTTIVWYSTRKRKMSVSM